MSDDTDDNWYHTSETLADMQKALGDMCDKKEQKEEKTFTIPSIMGPVTVTKKELEDQDLIDGLTHDWFSSSFHGWHNCQCNCASWGEFNGEEDKD